MPVDPGSFPYGPNTSAIRRFLQRFAALSTAEWGAAAERYAALAGTPRFAGADRALSAAVSSSQRERERDAALGPLLRIVALPAADGAPPDAPPPLDPVAEAALAAVLALLVRDVLSASALATLYAPFEPLIPLASLTPTPARDA